ncbi:ATP-binding cassette domain-containing protein [Nonomuraea sp. NBC_01738]|uniref:ATP-binding cassette domain-containing protein n=1 Tax=Nonomuraea sp. NBC_01738 TaxID=2976003 RepID=UPI002E15F6EB|nr:ATP-binding cassette domain-containing protein [Nonomuraea sp. NBC_01738]
MATPAGTPVIEASDLTRVFRRPKTSLTRPGEEVHALKGVSLSVARGERFGIVGESGSGKSTLLKLLCGLDQPTSGSILFDGKEIVGRRDLRFLRNDLQIVFQDPMSSLDPRMKVRDIVAEPLVALGLPAGDRVAQLLKEVGLPPAAADRYPHQFSGGQRQRIAIARALAPKPKVLVADEPVSALDVSVRGQILNLLADLIDSHGLTLVFVSHDLSVVRHVCESVAVMSEGQVVERGQVDEIWADPQHEYTRTLLRAVPTLEGLL